MGADPGPLPHSCRRDWRRSVTTMLFSPGLFVGLRRPDRLLDIKIAPSGGLARVRYASVHEGEGVEGHPGIGYRKVVVSGQGVSVRVDLSGRGRLTTQKTK